MSFAAMKNSRTDLSKLVQHLVHKLPDNQKIHDSGSQLVIRLVTVML